MTIKERLEKVKRFTWTAHAMGHDDDRGHWVHVDDYDALKRAFDKAVEQRDKYKSKMMDLEKYPYTTHPLFALVKDEGEILDAYEGGENGEEE